ncbi:RNA-binding domain-containing protein [Clavulina sp. PMI_390]|nr:RNA-binding domain-containing protein [Clavulina sp. PMI_390]
MLIVWLFWVVAGEVLFAEVLVTPTGVSKGCGIVEYGTREEAQRAIRDLAEQQLLGRPVFIREDREDESRFGATPVPGKMGAAIAHGSGGGGRDNAYGGPRAPPNATAGNQLYVGNLPYQAGWQDLKDLFRSAGNIIRADINIAPDGRAKGSGTVVFETVKDAQNAISMYHGYEWYGRMLEVREDRFAGLSGGRGRGLRGVRGGLGRGGMGGRGGFGGRGDRQFSDDIYAPYEGPDSGSRSAGNGNGSSFAPTGPSSSGGRGAKEYPTGPPGQQIMVRNLPWSTANEDLIDLFETTGTVEIAEILYSGTRSMGSGVVQFASTAEAETAISKFQGYLYGGRPLDVRFNDRWHEFTGTAAKGNSATAAA